MIRTKRVGFQSSSADFGAIGTQNHAPLANGKVSGPLRGRRPGQLLSGRDGWVARFANGDSPARPFGAFRLICHEARFEYTSRLVSLFDGPFSPA